MKRFIQGNIFLLAMMLVGTTIGLIIYTFVYAKGFSYFSSDPQACMNCHIMKDQYDGWSKSSHRNVTTCNSCHAPENIFAKYFNKAENGFFHSLHFTTGNYPDPIQIKPHNSNIVKNNCLKCHGQLFSDTTHPKELIEGRSCFKCHKDIGHTH